MRDFIKMHRSEIFISVIFAIFVVFAMFDVLNARAVAFVESSFNFSLSSIGVLAVLKIVSGALPLTSGVSDILDKIFNFFFFANILIGLEYVLLLTNKILALKVAIVAVFLLRFIPQIRTIATKILIILLFFNPGLNIYINCIDLVAAQANMGIDKKLSDNIMGVKRLLGIESVPNVEFEELGDTRSGLSRMIGNIAIFSENVSESAKSITDKVANPIDTTTKALDSAKNKILNSMSAIGESLNIVLNLTIKYILNVFFLFFLMPVVYFYTLYRILGVDFAKMRSLKK